MRQKNLVSRKTQVWGLTGGIASGKTSAAHFFALEGAPVIDADEIARLLSAPAGKAYQAILKRFGTADRAALREEVFNNSKSRKDLEAILHPLIVEESDARIRRLKEAGKKLIIYEATLLVETGRYKNLDGLIVVSSPRELRKKRLISRNSFSDDLAERILNAQIQDPERLSKATVVFENSGSLYELHQKVRQFLVDQSFVTS